MQVLISFFTQLVLIAIIFLHLLILKSGLLLHSFVRRLKADTKSRNWKIKKYFNDEETERRAKIKLQAWASLRTLLLFGKLLKSNFPSVGCTHLIRLIHNRTQWYFNDGLLWQYLARLAQQDALRTEFRWDEDNDILKCMFPIDMLVSPPSHFNIIVI